MTAGGDGLVMMPWFHRDFLAATQGWTAAETGAYFLLLGAQWEMGPLPVDTTALSSIARCSVKEFKTVWKKVSKKFKATDAGLVNARLEQHRAQAHQLRERHRIGAQETNTKRWGVAGRIAERSLSDTHTESLSVSPLSPSLSPSLRRLTKGERYLQSEDLEAKSLNQDGAAQSERALS